MTTPGPWTVMEKANPLWKAQIAYVGFGFCISPPTHFTESVIDAEACRANARLIAAAPELLVACRAAALELQSVGAGHGHMHSIVVLAQVDAAIAKAEGRP